MHAKRQLKMKARILVKGSWTLVGVVDSEGFLEEGEIYASCHEPRGTYLSGGTSSDFQIAYNASWRCTGMSPPVPLL